MSKKSSQLVCQYLENVSRAMLEKYQDIIRSFVHRRNGVYALYRRGGLYYVGLASGLFGRLKIHLKDRHGDTWDRFSVYLTIGPQYMREIEALLVRIAEPPGNKQKGKFIKSENLLPDVRAEYRTRKAEEEEDLFGKKKKVIDKPKKKRSEKKPGRKTKLAEYTGDLKRIRGSIRGTFGGKTFWAHVRKDGSILFKGKKFYSPTAAAQKCGFKGAINGWSFWKYERAPGYWVPIAELRR